MVDILNRIFVISCVAVVTVFAADCAGSDPILPPRSDVPAYTQAVVEKGIDRYEKEGRGSYPGVLQ